MYLYFVTLKHNDRVEDNIEQLEIKRDSLLKNIEMFTDTVRRLKPWVDSAYKDLPTIPNKTNNEIVPRHTYNTAVSVANRHKAVLDSTYRLNTIAMKKIESLEAMIPVDAELDKIKLEKVEEIVKDLKKKRLRNILIAFGTGLVVGMALM